MAQQTSSSATTHNDLAKHRPKQGVTNFQKQNVTRSVKTQHNRISLNFQYKELNSNCII